MQDRKHSEMCLRGYEGVVLLCQYGVWVWLLLEDATSETSPQTCSLTGHHEKGI